MDQSRRDSTERISIFAKYLVLHWIPDCLGMIHCLGKNVISNGIGKKIESVRKYNWPLNNTCLTFVGALVPGFFFSKYTFDPLLPVSHPWIQPTADN